MPKDDDMSSLRSRGQQGAPRRACSELPTAPQPARDAPAGMR